MKINLASVFVDDQNKALSFYTETLGFVKKTEMPRRPSSPTASPLPRRRQRCAG
jgi:hypothetical protein